MSTVSQQLASVALERGLRPSTVYGYERLLRRLGMLDLPVDQVTQDRALEALWSIDNPNTRRSAVICLRAVFGWKIKIPRGVPKRYTLPDEDTLRLALMLSPHEVRGLLMMYAGLRVGEACAVTAKDMDGDRLTVAKQVLELHRTGSATTRRVAPVKTSEGTVIVPVWLSERVSGLSGMEKPSSG